MSGTLYFDGQKPVVGTRVIVVVDEVNSPTGIWDGELTKVGEDDSPVSWDGRWEFQGSRWVDCKVRFTDSHAPKEYRGSEPTLNYNVYVATSGSQYLRQRLTDANTEIRGLKRRQEIERGVWHAALKAIVNQGAIAKLEKLLNEFLDRIDR